MPTYEYECLDQGHRFDVVQSFRDDALTACQLCGGRVRKVFSAAGIVFKGSGFYVTDSRKASGAKKSAAKSGDNGTSSEPASSKSGSGSGSSESGSSESGSGSSKSGSGSSESTSTSGRSAD